MAEKLIRKTHSKGYPLIIELKVPLTFYWAEDGYDGVEIMVENCSKHQIKIAKDIMNVLGYQMVCSKLVDFLREKHMDELKKYVSEISAESVGVPTAFVEAFEDEDK